MKHDENLLVVAMEESAELQQELSKALRFGAENYHPDEPNISNAWRIQREFHQLRAVIDMLIIRRIISPMPESEQSRIYRDKVEQVEKWERYSESIGKVKG